MQALCCVLAWHPLVAAIFRAFDQGTRAVDVEVVGQMASLDLFVASIGLVGALDDEIIQYVE